MKKKQNTKQSQAATDHDEHDWQPLFVAVGNVTNWAMDVASKLSRDCPEDQDSIENVRAFVHAWLAGRRSEVAVSDVLNTIAIVFSAIEFDRGLDSVTLLGSLQTMTGTPSTLPAILRVPGASRRENPTVVVRRFPRHRNVNPAELPFAA